MGDLCTFALLDGSTLSNRRAPVRSYLPPRQTISFRFDMFSGLDDDHVGQRIFLLYLVSVIGIAFNLGVLSLGIDVLEMHAMATKVLATSAVLDGTSLHVIFLFSKNETAFGKFKAITHWLIKALAWIWITGILTAYIHGFTTSYSSC